MVAIGQDAVDLLGQWAASLLDSSRSTSTPSLVSEKLAASDLHQAQDGRRPFPWHP